MKRNFILILVLTLALTGQGQSFKEYYRSADKLKKENLKSAVGRVIKNHTKRSYDDLKTDYKTVYVVDGTTQQVYDLFSDEQYNYSSGGWNREHVIPNSWWGGVKNEAYSDLFSVIPSEISANSRKSNYPPAELYDVDYDSGRIKVGSPDTGLGGNYKNCWEPYDEYKGDFARIFFYVATCYDDITWGAKSSVKSEINKNAWPTLEPWLYKMLLKWHNADPVSAKEIKINDAVQGIQGNRNPFIDYPILVDYIWGDLQTETFYLDSVEAHVHYNGSGPVIDPDTTVIDTTEIDTTEIDTIIYQPGDLIFADDFDSVEEGNYTSTGGSSTPWTEGDEFFPHVQTIYQAGGAIRMGTGKKAGQIISAPINYVGTGAFVEIDVKGWDKVEAGLKVDFGGDKQTATYTAKIGDRFETVSLDYTGEYDHPTLDITTTATGRCFIDAVRVYAPKEDTTGINGVVVNSKQSTVNGIFDLTGRKVNAETLKAGIYIVNGKKVIIK